MHISLSWLFQVRAILYRHLLGIDVATGKREAPNLRLPVSMKRHLRRVLEAVEDDIKIAKPEHEEFVKKWAGEDGKLPEFNPTGDSEYDLAFREFFGTPDMVIPFSPFKLELLDKWDEFVPDEITGMMEEMNMEFENQKNAEAAKAAEVKNTGAETPTPNA
jgi:hypothetical protein